MKKRIASLFFAAALCLSFVACAPDENNTDNEYNEETGSIQIGMDEGDLSFGLSQSETPSFDDTVDDGGSEYSAADMYVIIGEYAYRLDPVTMLPMDPPLDPETHEPIVIKEEPEEDGETLPMGSEEQESVDDVPSAEEPNDQNKYPNTGVYEED